mmetsp:Transcript_9206/g.27711  ORF Transcript_9206/g.27711 Transcript_9206/m.27711 type:complete len:338 (-) Transcript_9206:1479-2492(-)
MPPIQIGRGLMDAGQRRWEVHVTLGTMIRVRFRRGRAEDAPQPDLTDFHGLVPGLSGAEIPLGRRERLYHIGTEEAVQFGEPVRIVAAGETGGSLEPGGGFARGGILVVVVFVGIVVVVRDAVPPLGTLMFLVLGVRIVVTFVAILGGGVPPRLAVEIAVVRVAVVVTSPVPRHTLQFPCLGRCLRLRLLLLPLPLPLLLLLLVLGPLLPSDLHLDVLVLVDGQTLYAAPQSMEEHFSSSVLRLAVFPARAHLGAFHQFQRFADFDGTTTAVADVIEYGLGRRGLGEGSLGRREVPAASRLTDAVTAREAAEADVAALVAPHPIGVHQLARLHLLQS